jgi:predicted RNase H-like HicB family nuclease
MEVIMTFVYPVVFTPTKDGWYNAVVPDFPVNTPVHTQGKTLADVFFMARDAIGLMGITLQDDGIPLPTPSRLEDITHESGEIISLIDIDFEAYRRANDQRAVRRNVSLPSWLNEAAERAGLNVSAILQNALKNELQ